MTRLEAAVAELAAAIREDLARQAPEPDPPESVLTVTEAAAALKIGRSRLYRELTAEPPRLRSIVIGRARRIPRSALADYLLAGQR